MRWHELGNESFVTGGATVIVVYREAVEMREMLIRCPLRIGTELHEVMRLVDTLEPGILDVFSEARERDVRDELLQAIAQVRK
jgi:hypothetical protein